jgi:hypothetical protein
MAKCRNAYVPLSLDLEEDIREQRLLAAPIKTVG